MIICCLLGFSACANTPQDSVKFNTLQVKDGTVYGEVSNDTTSFSFIDEISLKGSATYDVFTDLACKEIIPSKTVELISGNNVFYILVKKNNNVALFTVTIRRRPLYLVTISLNNNEQRQYVEENEQINEPQQPNVNGFLFDYWEINGSKVEFPYTVVGNVTIKAKFVADKYTVTFDVNGGEPLSQSNMSIDYGENYVFEIPVRTGYKFEGWYDSYSKMPNNGRWDYAQSKTLVAKWSINSYDVVLNQNFSNAGSITSTDERAEYNSKITISAIDNEYLGYTWLGWYDGEILLTTALNFTFNVPAYNINFTATWKVDEKLKNYEFTSNKTDCLINCVKTLDITQLDFPEYVTEIADYAFLNCKNLSQVVVPNNVISIGFGAFKGCSNIESITLPFVGESIESSNTHFGYIFGVENYSEIDNLIPATLEEVKVTMSTTIANNSFYGCSTLRNIKVPITTKYIGANAFKNCYNLNCFTMPLEVETVGSGAFSGCNGLEYIDVLDISSWCTIDFEDETANPLHIVNSLYVNNEEILNLIIPETVTYIGKYTFYGCENLLNIALPNTLISIGEFAFSNCKNLTSMIIPENVEMIGFGIFKDNNKIHSLTIPYIGSSLEEPNHIGYFFGIKDYAYNQTLLSQNIKSVVITQSLSLADYAFYSCRGLTSITLPSSLTKIGAMAFTLCDNLQRVNISNITSWCGIDFHSETSNPLSIAHNLYIDDELVKDVTLSDDISEIKEYAFYASSIESIIFSNTVKTIQQRAFFKNENLSNICFGNGLINIGNEAFKSCISLTSIEIPDSVIKIDFNAFNRCTSLKSIIIPKNVATIESGAFDYCEQLTIYCENSGKQQGWDSNWNPQNRPVVWNYVKSSIYA